MLLLLRQAVGAGGASLHGTWAVGIMFLWRSTVPILPAEAGEGARFHVVVSGVSSSSI